MQFTVLRLVHLLAVMLAVCAGFQRQMMVGPSHMPAAAGRSMLMRRISAIRAGAAVEEIKSKVDFDRKLSEAGSELVVVDFSASWCMPCKMISPVYESLSKKPEYKDVHFFKVDVDEAQELAQAYQIRSMPTFLFIRNGQVIENFSGALVDKLQSTVAGLATNKS